MTFMTHAQSTDEQSAPLPPAHTNVQALAPPGSWLTEAATNLQQKLAGGCTTVPAYWFKNPEYLSGLCSKA